MEFAPAGLRALGLVDMLRAAPGLAGVEVRDVGDLAIEPGFRPDPDPRAKNRAEICAFLPRERDLVAAALGGADGAATRLLVLGGDCTAHAGAMAGLRAARPDARYAIAWFDAHGDFNTPDTTPSGNVWGMPFAMLCGRGDPDLVAACDGPTVMEQDAALFGGQVLDETESRMLASSRVAQFRGRDARHEGRSGRCRGLGTLGRHARRRHLHRVRHGLPRRRRGMGGDDARARRPRPRDGRGHDPGPGDGDAGRRASGRPGSRWPTETGRRPRLRRPRWPRRPSRQPEGALALSRRTDAGRRITAPGAGRSAAPGSPPVARPIAIRIGPACETTTTSSPASTSSRQAVATRSASSAARSPSGQSMSVSPSASRAGEVGREARQLIEGEALGDPEIGLAPAVVERDALDPGRLCDRARRRLRAARRAGDDARAGRQGRGEIACKLRGRRPAGVVERRVAPPAVPMSRPGGRCVPDQDDAGHLRPARIRRAPRPSDPRSPPTRTSPSRRAAGPRRRSGPWPAPPRSPPRAAGRGRAAAVGRDARG